MAASAAAAASVTAVPSLAKGTAWTLTVSRASSKPTAALTVSSMLAWTAAGTSSLTCTAMDWLVTVPGVFSTWERTRLTPLRWVSEVLE